MILGGYFMEKKILTDEVLYTSELLSDTNEYSNTKTYLTEENKILKIIPDKEEQSPAFQFHMEQFRMDNANCYLLLGSSNFEDFILKSRELLEQKVLCSYDFKDLRDDLSLPTTMYYRKDGTFIGYEQEKVEGKSLYDHRKDLVVNHKLTTYLLLQLTGIVKNANERGITITDLSNLSNILVTPELKIKLIDYDDFQINNLLSIKNSAILSPSKNPILKSKKYINQGFYTNNLDKASLLNTMYYLLDDELGLLGTDTSTQYQEHVVNDRVDNFVYYHGYNYPDLFSELLDPKNQPLKDATKRVFDLEQENIYPDEAIKEYAKRLS